MNPECNISAMSISLALGTSTLPQTPTSASVYFPRVFPPFAFHSICCLHQFWLHQPESRNDQTSGDRNDTAILLWIFIAPSRKDLFNKERNSNWGHGDNSSQWRRRKEAKRQSVEWDQGTVPTIQYLRTCFSWNFIPRPPGFVLECSPNPTSGSSWISDHIPSPDPPKMFLKSCKYIGPRLIRIWFFSMRFLHNADSFLHEDRISFRSFVGIIWVWDMAISINMGASAISSNTCHPRRQSAPKCLEPPPPLPGTLEWGLWGLKRPNTHRLLVRPRPVKPEVSFWAWTLPLPPSRRYKYDEYKHGFTVPKTHTHKPYSTARPGVQSTPDSQ